MIECIRVSACGPLIFSLFLLLCGPAIAEEDSLVIPSTDSPTSPSSEESSVPIVGESNGVDEPTDDAPSEKKTESDANADKPDEAADAQKSANDTNSDKGKQFKSAINFVFDCSGSMGLSDVPNDDDKNDQRGKVCKDAVSVVIEDLQDTDVGVGLVLFGHRSYWSRTDDGKYEVLLSEMGKKQELKADEFDPSFDLKQEVKVNAPTEKQVSEILETLAEVTFNRGAQAPCYQSIDEAFTELVQLPKRVASREMIVVTDGFNQLADAKATSEDLSLQALAAKVQTHNQGDDIPVQIHLVMFGKTFEKNDDGEFSTTDIKNRVEALVKFAEDSGGTLQTATNAEEIADVLTGLTVAADSKRSGKVVGEIHKNSSIVSGSNEFKVTLEAEGSNFKPVTTKDGKFSFDKVPTAKKYTIKVKGRIRNKSFEVELDDVEASTKPKPEPVKVNLD